MVSSHLAVGVSLMLVASFVSTEIDAFATPTSPLAWGQGRIASTAEYRPYLAASLLEETTLTDDDEDVLFGSSSVQHEELSRRVNKSGAILPDNSNRRNPLDHSSDPLVNKLCTMRETVTSCPAIWKELAAICPDKLALLDFLKGRLQPYMVPKRVRIEKVVVGHRFKKI